jgi:serine/threonine-protein kinase
MEKNRWGKIQEIVDTALTLSGKEKHTYLETTCGGDENLLQEVKDFLASIEASEQANFLSNASSDYADFIGSISNLEKVDSDDLTGKKYGPFKILELINKGGMGEVYKAAREDGKFEQTVAIKFINRHKFSDDIKKRFQREQQILANMKHPNIAMLFDGGMTSNGSPYLIMEFVEGVPIDEYCNTHKLNVDQRLWLYKQVLTAIEYSHSNLIVHRDLKPSNILVTEEGRVKILDFGIAKLLDDEIKEGPEITQSGMRIWTPKYAAPEQIREHPPLLQTDIYGLGILLHQLLTNTFPYDLENKSVKELENLILDEDPTSMSECLKSRSKGEILKEFTITKESLIKKVFRDLDSIVLKAIRKEPDERYGSVSSLLEEINRFEQNLPVEATRGNISYKVKKYVRRNKVLVSAMCLLFVILTSATLISLNFAYETQKAEEHAVAEATEARRQTEISNSVNNFLAEVFAQADPYKNPNGDSLLLSEAIAIAGRKIDNSSDYEPEIEAAIRYSLGNVDLNLGRLDSAIIQFEKTLSLAREHFGIDNRRTIQAASFLGLTYTRTGNYEKAESVLLEVLPVARAAPQADWDIAAQIDNHLGLLYLNTGDGEKAEIYLREAIARDSVTYPGDHSDKLTTIHNLSGALWMQGKQQEAIEIGHDVFDRRMELHDGYHPTVAQSLNLLAFFNMRMGNLEESLKYREQDLEMRKSLYTGDHPDLARGYHNSAYLLNLLGRNSEAVEYEEKAIAMWKNTLPPTHSDIVRGLLILSDIYHNLDRCEDAIIVREEQLALYRQTADASPGRVAELLREIGSEHSHTGNIAETRNAFEQALSIQKEDPNTPDEITYLTSHEYGQALHSLGVDTEAENMILESAIYVSENNGSISEGTLTTILNGTVNFYQIIGKNDLAEVWQSRQNQYLATDEE